MTRNELKLSMQGKPNGYYEYTKSLIISDDLTKLDEWLENVIGSLFYSVNHKLLVIHGKRQVGKTQFITNILKAVTYPVISARSHIYSDFIINLDSIVDKTEVTETRRLLSNDGFVINEEDEYSHLPYCEKRLSSFVTSTNDIKKFTGSKRCITLEFEHIDPFIDSVDTRLLWIDIYNTFKIIEYGK